MLNESQVQQRRAAGQANNINLTPSRTYAHIIRKNVLTFVNIVLFSIGVILVLLGSPSDAVATAGLVTMNVLIGLGQEIRAKRKLDQITLLARPRVTVIRQEGEHQVLPDDIVLGDWLRLKAGDQIVCDGVIVDTGQVEVDESLLTGESDRILKKQGDAVYSGSICIAGSAVYEVKQVGAGNVANQITAKARTFKTTLTPLQRDINRIVRWVSITCTLIGMFFILRMADDLTTLERVQIVAVIMGTIPAGLIFLTTLAYGLGAVRMAGQGVLVQQINAVESMSHVTVLCMDKTGTITTNNILLENILPYQITEAEFRTMLGQFVASSISHNQTSEAIAKACPASKSPIQHEVTFSSERKWSGITWLDSSTQILGAPEVIAQELPPEITQQVKTWSEQGLRVLAFMQSPTPLRDNTLPVPRTLLGLVCLRDELRPNTRQTLTAFQQANIQLKIISGDHPQTVAALAKQVGFEGHAISGLTLATLDDAAFAQAAQVHTIFGRITPDQKERLMQSLRKQGAYVAMIGDGVNDVMALKSAQIGIAMHSGSPATRNVADLILLDDSFAALPHVFMEGQRIINGVLDTMRLLLTRTTYVLSLISIMGLFGVAFPFLPTQDTLNSFLTAGLPPFLLTLWATNGTPPKNLLQHAGRFIIPSAVGITFIGSTVYLLALSQFDLEIARTLLVITVITCGAMIIPLAHASKRSISLTIGILALLVITLYIEPLRTFFDLQLP